MIYHSKILEKLEQKNHLTGGHCGLYITDFVGEIKEIKKAINELFVEKKITIHDGIHGKMIKISNKGLVMRHKA